MNFWQKRILFLGPKFAKNRSEVEKNSFWQILQVKKTLLSTSGQSGMASGSSPLLLTLCLRTGVDEYFKALLGIFTW